MEFVFTLMSVSQMKKNVARMSIGPSGAMNVSRPSVPVHHGSGLMNATCLYVHKILNHVANVTMVTCDAMMANVFVVPITGSVVNMKNSLNVPPALRSPVPTAKSVLVVQLMEKSVVSKRTLANARMASHVTMMASVSRAKSVKKARLHVAAMKSGLSVPVVMKRYAMAIQCQIAITHVLLRHVVSARMDWFVTIAASVSNPITNHATSNPSQLSTPIQLIPMTPATRSSAQKLKIKSASMLEST